MEYMASFAEEVGDIFNSGQPLLREWFLVKDVSWVLFLCAAYLLVVKLVGPELMKNRKPFVLKIPMILYNFSLVLIYIYCLFKFFRGLREMEFEKICRPIIFTQKNLPEKLTDCAWIVYISKYVEFLDTIFFVLRKKNNQISNLHVIHHTAVPVVAWVLLRTELSIFQSIPVVINSIVHIVMYTYYGLSAIGPSVRKHLWWKRYLTVVQMTQFVVMFLFPTVLTPLAGCSVAKSTIYLYMMCAVLFFVLFANFYWQTFKTKSARPSADSAPASLKSD